MPTRKSPRKGSLQFWPRKRAKKFLPRVNWNAISSEKNLKGFICYKAGMASAYVKDETLNSMTKGKKITIPVTILECPSMRIFSVRFYKNKKVVKEILADKLEKELKRKVKIPKEKKSKIEDLKSENKENFDDIRVLCYSQTKETKIKKTPDLSEIGLCGTLEEKIDFVEKNFGKDISVLDIFEKGKLVDIRGLTKGKGTVGPVKRFGIKLRKHKSEKGRRRPGSLGPWHPARVTFRAPMAGQLGMFTRIIYNNKIIDIGRAENKNSLQNIKNFGNLKTDYIVVNNSVQGSAKRPLILTSSLRKTKKQQKKNYEFIELR